MVYRLLLIFWTALWLPAAVVDLQIAERAPVANGRTFGAAGAYERLKGKVHFAVDPKHAGNSNITDIEFAPRNVDGMVEFSADLYILRPADLQKGNATILFEVPNRGGKGMLGVFNRAKSSKSPVAERHLGDGRLLNQGYTLVWLGWQHDAPPAAESMRLYPPVARGVKGLVRAEYVPTTPVKSFSLGDAGHTPYASLKDGKVTVSTREDIYGQRTELARELWSLTPVGMLKLASPATPGLFYEVIYESSNPPVAGLGLAAVRDLISHLKKEHKYAIGFGTSQSAMLLRALLYEGFNQDERGKRVFDGIFAHVAGARRSTFQRFTQPSRTAGPLRNASFSSTGQFPFSDATQLDPVTGLRDGLLHKAEAAGVVPKIFYTNSAYEYWGSGASLLHTAVDGLQDIELPATSRMYVFSGGQHGPAAFPPKSTAAVNPPNFNDYRWSHRALLDQLRDWIVKDSPPPPSEYPRLSSETLTPLANYKFPNIPEIRVPTIIHTPHRLDFGKHYLETGIVTLEPPGVGEKFVTQVPQADPDGNDLGGIRMPELACAIATYSGWNLRHPNIGAEKYLLGNTGSYLPFPGTAEEQRQDGDPRKPVSERFEKEDDYLRCVERHAHDLTRRGFLLASDARPIVEAASRHWRWLMGTSRPELPASAVK